MRTTSLSPHRLHCCHPLTTKTWEQKNVNTHRLSLVSTPMTASTWWDNCRPIEPMKMMGCFQAHLQTELTTRRQPLAIQDRRGSVGARVMASQDIKCCTREEISNALSALQSPPQSLIQGEDGRKRTSAVCERSVCTPE